LSVAWHRAETRRSGAGRGRPIDVACGAPEPGPGRVVLTSCAIPQRAGRDRGGATRTARGRDPGTAVTMPPFPGRLSTE